MLEAIQPPSPQCAKQIKNERKQFIKAFGAPDTYLKELSEELKGVEYDRFHILKNKI